MGPGPEYPLDTARSEAELLGEGWLRRFVAEEPRLTESVDLYLELGFDVALRRLAEADLSVPDCTACFRTAPHLFRILYTRPR